MTAPGARLLAARLARPLLDPGAIDVRLDAVAWFCERRPQRQKLREALKGLGDMARALSRLALGRGGPRDLGCLRDGLTIGEAVTGLFAATRDPLVQPPLEVTSALAALTPALHPDLAQFRALLADGLGDDLPTLARDGGFVREGARPELDQARALRDDQPPRYPAAGSPPKPAKAALR